MLLQELEHFLPNDWQPMDVYHERYKVIQIPAHSQEFYNVYNKIKGNYYIDINGIFKLQNPLMYTKFKLKSHEYTQRGRCDTKWLYHDTARENTQSIAMYNIDWRYGERFKFGPGVYFSVSPTLANKHSSKQNGPLRTMFVVEVLLHNVQAINGDVFLPDFGFDTVLCHRAETYVKYFDCEYYPQYFVEYVSIN